MYRWGRVKTIVMRRKFHKFYFLWTGECPCSLLDQRISSFFPDQGFPDPFQRVCVAFAFLPIQSVLQTCRVILSIQNSDQTPLLPEVPPRLPTAIRINSKALAMSYKPHVVWSQPTFLLHLLPLSSLLSAPLAFSPSLMYTNFIPSQGLCTY